MILLCIFSWISLYIGAKNWIKGIGMVIFAFSTSFGIMNFFLKNADEKNLKKIKIITFILPLVVACIFWGIAEIWFEYFVEDQEMKRYALNISTGTMEIDPWISAIVDAGIRTVNYLKYIYILVVPIAIEFAAVFAVLKNKKKNEK